MENEVMSLSNKLEELRRAHNIDPSVEYFQSYEGLLQYIKLLFTASGGAIIALITLIASYSNSAERKNLILTLSQAFEGYFSALFICFIALALWVFTCRAKYDQAIHESLVRLLNKEIAPVFSEYESQIKKYKDSLDLQKNRLENLDESFDSLEKADLNKEQKAKVSYLRYDQRKLQNEFNRSLEKHPVESLNKIKEKHKKIVKSVSYGQAGINFFSLTVVVVLAWGTWIFYTTSKGLIIGIQGL